MGMKRELLLILVLLTAACIGGGQQTVQGPLKGVSLSPKSFDAAGFTDFFEKREQFGNAVMWAGDWNELGSEQGGPKIVVGLAEKYGYVPIVEATYYIQGTGKLVRPLDATTRANYKAAAAEFAEKYKPKYMGFGIEVNIMYEKSPADFEEFVVLYSETYDAVKAASPETKVFTVFQLERMKGLKDGLFGGTNDEGNWALLDRFPKSDIVAFTTYPGLIFKDPSEIPSDYYSEIAAHAGKPIAFTESGWPSGSKVSGWESTESEQSEFVVKFGQLTSGLNREILLWSFLYDPQVGEPFSSTGLFYTSGTAKAAWPVWVNLKV